jgi:hypothetical protein
MGILIIKKKEVIIIMYCPDCKRNFDEGLTICPECGKALTDFLPEKDHIEIEGFIPVKIASVANDIEAELIRNLLLNNNIPCFKKNNESGGYMNIYMGYSIFGEEIYVDEKDAQTAKDLLNSLKPDQDYMDYDDSHTGYKLPFYRNPRIVARILLVIMAASMIISGLLNLV